MKSILNFVAVCAVVALVGCNSTKSTTSPGAVSDTKSGCCAEAKASPGAVSDKASCTKTCPATGQTVSPGAVGEKSGCCKSQSSCTKTETVSPGAVSEKSGCCKSKTSGN